MFNFAPVSKRRVKVWVGVGVVFLVLLSGTCLFFALGSPGHNKACFLVQAWLCERGIVGTGRLEVPDDYTGTWTFWGVRKQRSVEEYRNGMRHGTTTHWDADGKLEVVLLHRDGQITHRLSCSGLAVRLNDPDPSVNAGTDVSPIDTERDSEGGERFALP